MQVLFFQEHHLDISDRKGLIAPMISMAQETLTIGKKNSTVKGVLVELDKYGCLVSQEELLKVAYILNVKITDELQNTNLPSSLDFTTILASYSDIKPCTLKDLQDFVSNRLNWKCYELGQASVYEEMWQIRSFFKQCTHWECRLLKAITMLF